MWRRLFRPRCKGRAGRACRWGERWAATAPDFKKAYCWEKLPRGATQTALPRCSKNPPQSVLKKQGFQAILCGRGFYSKNSRFLKKPFLQLFMHPRLVDYGGRTCFKVYLLWTAVSVLALLLIPPYLDATYPGGAARGLTLFTGLLPTAFYGYCAIALVYLFKFGVQATFRSLANCAAVLLLAYLQYVFWPE